MPRLVPSHLRHDTVPHPRNSCSVRGCVSTISTLPLRIFVSHGSCTTSMRSPVWGLPRAMWQRGALVNANISSCELGLHVHQGQNLHDMCGKSHGLSINAESPTFPSNLPLSVLSARMRFNCDAHLAMRFLVLPPIFFQTGPEKGRVLYTFCGAIPTGSIYIYIYMYMMY